MLKTDPTYTFPESNHPIVKSLFHHSDQELLTLFQNYPDQGKYFVAIFCRYGMIVQTLIQHSVRSPVQADYLFAQTWQHIFYELRGLDLREGADPTQENTTLQNWLINVTAISLNQAEIPPVESIRYSLQVAPPPLWCYVRQVLDQLEALLRLILLMSQTFHWSETRIAAYLQAEGETISSQEIKSLLQQGYHHLDNNLPEDIKAIYFNDDMKQVSTSINQFLKVSKEPES
ncbi:MAG: sigma-70 family RNA polymerase sigma factor [Okeania sp. SIO2C2]|uniref:sigma-70 family RNA polymerase sigma factor n=1 Tax=Okeania sp. SIO2C2 TaxID=2607787 RepID=UPI0013BC9789|nr:sigma-70 family RNA polymerase sigma factor [Okeania sp. SIO2C2]NEP88308.1 sigma-70 family RNA polymerase sigma factor [Okeania sp. SIO2C2]